MRKLADGLGGFSAVDDASAGVAGDAAASAGNDRELRY